MGTHLFDDLPQILQAYKVQIGKMVTLVAQKAALAGGTYLAQETPVDTGVARSNWVATIQAPFGGVLPAYVPYPSYRMNHHEVVKQATLSGRNLAHVRATRQFRPGTFKGGAP